MKYKFLLALALCFSLFTSCNKGKTNPPFSPIGQDEIPDNEIWYTTTDGKEIFPLVTDGFGASYISTTYREDKGIMLFDAAITDIPAGAFAYSDPLETMTLPKTVKTIGDYAFDQCRGLKDINVPANLESIGTHAFCTCGSLSVHLSFPSTLKKIGSQAFHTAFVEGVSFTSSTVPSVANDAFDADNFFIIHVPSDKYDDYKSGLGENAKRILTNHTVTKDEAAIWMSYLPDAMPLHMVTMPGSHDSGTYQVYNAYVHYDDLFPISDDDIKSYAQVQYVDYETQFANGVRYFDLRTAIPVIYEITSGWGVETDFSENPNGTVEVHHGYQNLFKYNGGTRVDKDYIGSMVQIYSCEVNYKDAVDKIIGFVKGTSEFAIIKQQLEIYDEGDPQYGYTQNAVLALQDEWLQSGDVVKFRPGLTVGDVRGKVIFWNYLNKWGSQPGAGYIKDNYILSADGMAEITVQDEYKLVAPADTASARKLNFFKKQAEDYADRDLHRELWCINQSSGYYMDDIEMVWPIGTQSVPWPGMTARYLHGPLLDYLDNDLPNKPAGIITLDYACYNDDESYGPHKRFGKDLVNTIFLHNFKFLGLN